MRFISPKTDFAFKRIFGSESSKPILISFLNSLIYNGASIIEDLTIIDPYQSGQVSALKDSYLDVKAILKDKTVVIIEMQVLRYPDFDRRILYNAAKAYVNQLEKGMRYGLLNPVIALTITDFTLFDSEQIINKFEFKESTINLNYLHQGIRLIFVELPKFNKSLEQLETVTDKWLYFLKEADSLETIPNSLENVTEIQQALIIANEANLSSRELDQLESQRFFLQDQEYILELQQQALLENQQLTEEKQQLTEEKQQLTEEKQQLTEEKQQLTEEKQQLARELAVLLESQQRFIISVLRQKMGQLEASTESQILQLSYQKLMSLGEALSSFDGLENLIQWLQNNRD